MKFEGVSAPVPTPFDGGGQIDLVRFRAMVAHLAGTRLAGLVALGSTGEAVLLDEDESERVIAAAREAWPAGRPLVAGTGRESTAATVRATRIAAGHGADAVLVRTPGFYKGQMTADAFVRHYMEVADRSPVPVLLYNFTAVTGVNLPPAAVAKLAAHPNIAGVKESGSDMAQIAEFAAGAPAGFTVLAGSATTFHSALIAGATGGVLALSCVLPEACIRLFDLARAGRHDDARALQRQLAPIAKLVGSTHGVPGLKAAMLLAGRDAGVPRAPLAPASDAAVAALRGALDAFAAHILQPTS